MPSQLIASRRTVSIHRNGIPVIIPSSGTFAANGAVSGLVAMPTTYTHAYLYFPAAAISATSTAGFYYTVMSAADAGKVYNNKLPASGVPSIPASPTAFSCAGPGAYVQAITEITMQTLKLQGGILGPSGHFEVNPIFSVSATVNDKTLKVKLSSTEIHAAVPTTSETHYRPLIVCANRGSQSAQIAFAKTSFSGIAETTAAQVYGTVDTSVDQNITITGQLSAAATEYIVLEYYDIEAMLAGATA